MLLGPLTQFRDRMQNDFYLDEVAGADVAITREQIRELDRQQKVAGTFRLVDKSLGKLEQVLAPGRSLRVKTRQSLQQLFPGTLTLVDEGTDNQLPTSWLRDTSLQAWNVQKQERVIFIPDGLHQIRKKNIARSYLGQVQSGSEPIRGKFLNNFIEGGDLCPSGEYLFFSAHTVLRELFYHRHFLKQPGVSYEGVKALLIDSFSKDFGKKVIVLDKPAAPPLFHLDLYFLPLVRPTGKPIIILGDALLFIQSVLGMSAQKMHEEQQYLEWFYDQEFSNGEAVPFGVFSYEAYIKAIRFGPLARQYQDVVANTEVMAEHLEGIGFDVDRVPLPYLAHYPKCHLHHVPAASTQDRYLTCCNEDALSFSSLNGVAEAYPKNGKLVQNFRTATYGFRDVDKDFREKLGSYGCRVEMRPFFLGKAHKQGGVHCLTSEWRRGFIESGTLIDRVGQCL